jgi:hypothetical protein
LEEKEDCEELAKVITAKFLFILNRTLINRKRLARISLNKRKTSSVNLWSSLRQRMTNMSTL